MTLMSVPIDSIAEDHLRSLIEDQAMELRVIEYKQELPGKRPEDKREFLADVCSFANTAGGDLVYGMTEDGGMPRELPGFETSNIDGEINGHENSIRDGIGPRIWGVRSFPLQLRSGAHALVLRVPRSFSLLTSSHLGGTGGSMRTVLRASTRWT
jgi:Putative DNA-binding domain